jgi:hypothetical protein
MGSAEIQLQYAWYKTLLDQGIKPKHGRTPNPRMLLFVGGRPPSATTPHTHASPPSGEAAWEEAGGTRESNKTLKDAKSGREEMRT